MLVISVISYFSKVLRAIASFWLAVIATHMSISDNLFAVHDWILLLLLLYPSGAGGHCIVWQVLHKVSWHFAFGICIYECESALTIFDKYWIACSKIECLVTEWIFGEK